MIAADSSVVIAALAAWHPDHDRADEALGADVRIPAHCAIETYSVLTRLRPPHQVPADAALRALRARIRSPWLTLDARAQLRFLRRAQEAGIKGGAIYDALAAATAVHHECELLTLDRRALTTYRLIGASVRVPA